ncbi:hypothetical protein ABPG77_005022 [Micractinium sp. CCAP 211/92]
MPPRAVNPADEAASLSSTLTQPGGAGGGPSDRHVVHLGANDSDPDETNSRLRRRLRSFWNCHGTGFSEWWLALPEADREPFLRDIVPLLPARRGDLIVSVPDSARPEDCSRFSVFVPELNLADLTADGGRGLLDLFDQRVQQARRADELAAQGQRKLLVDDLEVKDGTWIENLLQA